MQKSQQNFKHTNSHLRSKPPNAAKGYLRIKSQRAATQELERLDNCKNKKICCFETRFITWRFVAAEKPATLCIPEFDVEECS
jgi:hypothetical protein